MPSFGTTSPSLYTKLKKDNWTALSTLRETAKKETTIKKESRPKLKSCLSSVSSHGGSKSPPSLKKTVSFHEVHIREFERIVGDNPAVSACPAVSIAWDHHSENTHKVDHVESLKPSHQKRDIAQFQIPASVRYDMLQKSGASKEEITQAQREIKKIQHERQASIAMQEFEGTQVLLESLGRKWKRRTSKKNNNSVQDTNNGGSNADTIKKKKKKIGWNSKKERKGKETDEPPRKGGGKAVADEACAMTMEESEDSVEVAC